MTIRREMPSLFHSRINDKTKLKQPKIAAIMSQGIRFIIVFLGVVPFQSVRSKSLLPNGLRKPCVFFTGYPLVGETRQRHFTGTSFKPRKLFENAQTPTSQVVS
jgi:hypothetical protein